MKAWGAGSPKKAAAAAVLAPQIQTLAADFKLVDGELLMQTKAFKAWLEHGNALPAAARESYAEELLPLASKFYEFGGESMAKAVAQLFALAADVMGKTIQDSR